MNADNAQLLAQLRDIHEAASPSLWPPAPGWWLLGAAALVVLLLGIRRLARWLAVRKRRRRLLDALDALRRDYDPGREPHEYLARLNRIFRRVALRAFPGAGCARLQGEDWVAFIRSTLPEREASEGLAALACGPYERAPEFDAVDLDRKARAWVRRYG